jgi:hypothetical protein
MAITRFFESKKNHHKAFTRLVPDGCVQVIEEFPGVGDGVFADHLLSKITLRNRLGQLDAERINRTDARDLPKFLNAGFQDALECLEP